MSDYLVKAISKNKQFRALAVDATELVATAQQKHDTWATSSAALGRTLVGSLLLSTALLKDDDKITVRIAGDGPVGRIVVDGNAEGTVRGYIDNPHVNLPARADGHIDVRGGVGTNGLLSLTKDFGFGDPFTGQVQLISGEIGEDFAFYLASSEQIPSAVGLSVFVNPNNTIGAAGGFLIQALPGATDDSLAKLEASIKKLPHVSELLLDKKTPEDLLNEIFDNQVDFLDTMPVSFKCTCSKEKFHDAMATLPKKDLQQMIDEDGGAEVVCKFCNNKYYFSKDELTDLVKG